MYAITHHPKTLTPSTSPSLGNQSQHHELHSYASDACFSILG